MKKTVGIVFFALLFTACGVGYFYKIGIRTHSTMFPEGHHGRSLAQLEQQLQVLRDRPFPRRVIAGPSYADALAGAGDSVNIGIRALYPRECLELVRQHCTPDDIILYPVSLYTVIKAHKRPRKEIVNTHFRRIEIGRLTTKNLLTQYTRQPFEGLSGDIVLKNQMRRAKHINWNKVDIQPFIELSEEYPNLIYILYPRFHGDKHFLRADRRFRTLFLTSGLPCINLTHALPDNSLFDDAWHASPAGNSVIRRHIRYAMDRSPVYQGSR